MRGGVRCYRNLCVAPPLARRSPRYPRATRDRQDQEKSSNCQSVHRRLPYTLAGGSRSTAPCRPCGPSHAILHQEHAARSVSGVARAQETRLVHVEQFMYRRAADGEFTPIRTDSRTKSRSAARDDCRSARFSHYANWQSRQPMPVQGRSRVSIGCS